MYLYSLYYLGDQKVSRRSGVHFQENLLMIRSKHWILLIPMVLSFGCIVYSEGPYRVEPVEEPAIIVEDEASHTRTKAIVIDGEKQGYLFTYEQVPVGSGLIQYFTPGTAFIKDLDFRNVGFISPNGETFRFDENSQPVKICQFQLIKNLAYFFENPDGQVEVQRLE
jgi:hypothetical protein